MKISTLLIAASLVAAAGSANAANLIVNGGFNNGQTVSAPGGTFATLGTNSTAMNGWTVTSGDIDWIQGYWQSADGDGFSVDLNGNNPGAISQTINTVAGQSYQLTFAMSANPDSTVDSTRIAVIGANGTIGSASYTLTAANSKSNMLWTTETFDFVANSSTTAISFTSGSVDGDCCYGAAIDNVAVAGVPEPATWALSILGLGLMGMALRRSAKTRLTQTA
jgi:choice-of-anchor C domain-containing protein